MIKVLSKNIFDSKDIAGLNKHIRTALFHDGSMSLMIQNLTNQKISMTILQEQILKNKQIDKNQLLAQLHVADQQILVRESSIKTLHYEVLIFARSFWSLNAYQQLMNYNPTGSIGLNLIAKEIQQFRKILWAGYTEINIHNQMKKGFARSYTIKSGGTIICQIQQFFTKNFEELLI